MAIEQEFPPLLDKGPSVGVTCATCTGARSTSSSADVTRISRQLTCQSECHLGDNATTSIVKPSMEWSSDSCEAISEECCSALGVELELVRKVSGPGRSVAMLSTV